MRPVQHQVLLKTLPGLAQSFGSIIDALSFSDAIATLCGDDVCLVICEDAEAAQKCFEELKKFAPPFFFEESWPPVKRVVCPRAISPNYQPAPKDAGFHFVQALLLLTRHLPLKEALVLLTTIPKGILIFFYT